MVSILPIICAICPTSIFKEIFFHFLTVAVIRIIIITSKFLCTHNGINNIDGRIRRKSGKWTGGDKTHAITWFSVNICQKIVIHHGKFHTGITAGFVSRCPIFIGIATGKQPPLMCRVTLIYWVVIDRVSA